MRFLVFNAVVFSALAYLFLGSFSQVAPFMSLQERDSHFNEVAAVNHTVSDQTVRPPEATRQLELDIQPAPTPSASVLSKPSIIPAYDPATASAAEPNAPAQQETELPPILTAEYIAPIATKEPQDVSLMTARERRKELNSLAREMDSLAIDKLFR